MISISTENPWSFKRAFTNSACHIARAEPREPIRIRDKPGRIIWLFEIEKTPHGFDHSQAAARLELRNRLMRHLVDDAARDLLDRRFLFRRQRAESAALAVDFSATNRFQVRLQRNNRGNRVERLQPFEKTVHFLVDKIGRASCRER